MNLGTILQNKMQPQQPESVPHAPPEQPAKRNSEIADTQKIVRKIRNRGAERGQNNYPDTSIS